MANLADIHREMVEAEALAERERPWLEYLAKMSVIGWRFDQSTGFFGTQFVLRAAPIAGGETVEHRLSLDSVRDARGVYEKAREVFVQVKRDAYLVEPVSFRGLGG